MDKIVEYGGFAEGQTTTPDKSMTSARSRFVDWSFTPVPAPLI